jgi:uncharacterized protein
LHPLLQSVAHRPWPCPPGPWIMKQTWNDLLFAHWPIPIAELRPLVPDRLALDTFEGQCWVGVVPFWMSGIRGRGLLALPGLSRFPELNVRTYVTNGGKPGVYFFSLDITSHVAVWGARRFYHLPYFHAAMHTREEGGRILYSCQRDPCSLPSRGGPGRPPLHEPDIVEFRANYRAVGPARIRDKGSLEDFLTARYCLYTMHEKQIYRCDIHHLPWPLQDAEASIERNTMAAAAQIALPNSAPLVHFSNTLEVLIWPLRRAD